MNQDQLTRRLFLQGSGSLAGSTMFRAAVPGIFALAQAACTARDEGMSFEVLSDAEAAAFEAIAARIIPTTDTPGAREAGVIHFMDKAFASFMQEDLDDARRTLTIKCLDPQARTVRLDPTVLSTDADPASFSDIARRRVRQLYLKGRI